MSLLSKKLSLHFIPRLRDSVLLINNAGRGITQSILNLCDDDLDLMIRVNVKSAFYGMQVAVKYSQTLDPPAGMVMNALTVYRQFLEGWRVLHLIAHLTVLLNMR